MTRNETIHLEILGQERSVDVEVPTGPSTLTDLLPAARSLSDDLAAAAASHARCQGKSITCGPGCAACCRQLVGISAIEAQGLTDVVARLPPERRGTVVARFAAAIERLEAAGLLDSDAPRGRRRLVGTEPGKPVESGQAASRRYFSLGIPCPFLENESCSIYVERPLMCREYNVTSPAEECARIHDGGTVAKATPPIHLGASLGRLAAQAVAAEPAEMPLTLALEWAAAHRAAMQTTVDGETLFGQWLSALDDRHQTSFDNR